MTTLTTYRSAACLFFLFLSLPLAAQPSREGRIQAADILLEVPRSARGPGVLSEREVFDRPGEEAFRLRFADVRKGRAPDGVRIVIRNRSDEVIEEIPFAALSARPVYWTRVLYGSYALVQIVGSTGASAQGFSLRIDRIGTADKGASLLSRQDFLNPKDRPIAEFGSNLPLVKASRSVAKLIISRDFETISCTGFMISSNLMMTNQHCISSSSHCSGSYAKFGYQKDAAGILSKGEDYRCLRLVDSDAGLDFAIVQLEGTPGSPDQWGYLQWANRTQLLGEPLAVVQHPDGEPKRVAVEGCKVTTLNAVGKLPTASTDFGHSCDTLTGSSGSPVLDASMTVLGLHHMGFDASTERWAFENRAVQSERLRTRVVKWVTTK